MKLSFADPEPHEFFKNGIMVIIPHSISVTGETNCQLVSQCANPISDQPNHLTAFASDCYHSTLTNAEFTRTLLFFGYRWVDEKGSVVTRDPTVMDVLHFTQLFDDVVITSNDELKVFIDKFKLNDKFSVDRDVCVLVNINRMGWLFRSFLPIRFSPCEGQHRWFCLSSFPQGLPDAGTKLPYEVKTLAEFEPQYQDIKKWQLFTRMNIRVCMPLSEKTDLFKECQALSMVLTAGQQTSVSFSFTDFLASVCRSIDVSEWQSLEMEEFSFLRFWHRNCDTDGTCVYLNTLRLKSFIFERFEKDEAARAQKALYDSKSWETFKSQFEKCFANKKSFGLDMEQRSITDLMLFLIFYIKSIADS